MKDFSFGLAAQASAHKPLNRLPGSPAPIEDRIHLCRNGQIHAVAGGKFHCGGGSFYTFCDHRCGVQNTVQFQARRKFETNLAVSAQIAGAGQNQVTQARQTRERLVPATECNRQPRYFSEAPGD